MAKIREARRYDLSSFKGLDIQSFAIREAIGEDTIRAAERCALPTGAQPDENLYSIMLRNQMIAGVIVEVDGQPVKGGACQAFLGWNEKTRKLVAKAYDRLNGTSKEDEEAFEKLLAGEGDAEELENEPEQLVPISSASGSR